MSSEWDYHLLKYQDGFKGSGNSTGANSKKHYYNLKERNEREMLKGFTQTNTNGGSENYDLIKGIKKHIRGKMTLT